MAFTFSSPTVWLTFSLVSGCSNYFRFCWPPLVYRVKFKTFHNPSSSSYKTTRFILSNSFMPVQLWQSSMNGKAKKKCLSSYQCDPAWISSRKISGLTHLQEYSGLFQPGLVYLPLVWLLCLDGQRCGETRSHTKQCTSGQPKIK